MGVRDENDHLQFKGKRWIEHFEPMKLVKKFFSCLFHFPGLVMSWVTSLMSLLSLMMGTCWALVRLICVMYVLPVQCLKLTLLVPPFSAHLEHCKENKKTANKYRLHTEGEVAQ